MKDFEIGSVKNFFGQIKQVFKGGEENIAFDRSFYNGQVKV